MCLIPFSGTLFKVVCSLWNFLCSHPRPSQHNWRLKKKKKQPECECASEVISKVMTSCPVTKKKAEIRGQKWIFQATDCQDLSLPSPPPPPAACQSSCATCSSRLDCQSCGSRRPLLGPDSSQCLASCPPGSYQADHTRCRREYQRSPCAASDKSRYC